MLDDSSHTTLEMRGGDIRTVELRSSKTSSSPLSSARQVYCCTDSEQFVLDEDDARPVDRERHVELHGVRVGEHVAEEEALVRRQHQVAVHEHHVDQPDHRAV